MHIQPKPATVKNPPEQFTGDVWFDVIATPQHENQRMVAGLVRFAPGARTAWHSHANGQTLHVTHGIARIQSRGGDIIRSTPDRPSTPHPMKNTGTAPPPTTSWSTSPCSRPGTTPAPVPPGENTSPIRNTTTPAHPEPHQSRRNTHDRSTPTGRRRPPRHRRHRPEARRTDRRRALRRRLEPTELSARDRSLITVTALIAGGHPDQLPYHLGRALENGVTRTELVEAITHLAFYTGWPAAMTPPPSPARSSTRPEPTHAE